MPYGYTRAPFIARSLMKPLIAKWRSLGAKVVVFYDDGMAVAPEKSFLQKVSTQMHCDLLRAGLVPGIEKCKWSPEKLVIWNGLVFDFQEKLIRIKQLRIENALIVLDALLEKWPEVTFREVARFVGKIISMAPVFEGLAQLCTRMLQNLINIKHYKNIGWDCYIQADCVALFGKSVQELLFWKNHLLGSNKRSFLDPDPAWIIWTDASDFAIGGFVAQLHEPVSNATIWSADNWLLGLDGSLPYVRGSALYRIRSGHGTIGRIHRYSGMCMIWTLCYCGRLLYATVIWSLKRWLRIPMKGSCWLPNW